MRNAPLPLAIITLATAVAATATAANLPASDPGRIRWRLDMASSISGYEVAVAADGTIYTSDNTQLYAIHPDGTVKWTRPGAGGGTPISFLADGTVIVGLGETVCALDPADGSTSSNADLAEVMVAVRQDTGVLVYSGGASGIPNFVAGLATSDGAPIWSVDLAIVGGSNEFMWTQRAPTSADGSTVYFTTRFASNSEPGAIYAVDITATGPSPVAAPDVAAGAGEGLRVTVAPNPFRAATGIEYSIEAPAAVRINVFDVAGRLVRTLEDGARPAGTHVVTWDGRDGAGRAMESGVYFYRVSAGDTEDRGKVVLTH